MELLKIGWSQHLPQNAPKVVKYLLRRKFLGTTPASLFLLTLPKIVAESLILIVLVAQDNFFSIAPPVLCNWRTVLREYHNLLYCTIKLYDKRRDSVGVRASAFGFDIVDGPGVYYPKSSHSKRLNEMMFTDPQCGEQVGKLACCVLGQGT